MTSKWDVVAAVKSSGLLTSDRIIIMMLVDVADADTAIVPEKWTPSLTELAKWTGLGRATVATRLKHLERLGWVKRDRPSTADALGRGERTCYHLAIGEAVEQVKASRPGGGRHGKPSSAAELGQPLNHPEGPGSATGLVQPLNQPSSAAEPPLVQPLNPPSSAAGHKKHPPTEGVSSTSSQQDPSSTPAPSAGESATLPGFETTEQTRPPKPKKRHRRPYGSPDFDAFWEIYPRKDDPKKAWSCWQSALNVVETHERAELVADIIAGAKRYRDDPNRDPAFTKLATTWLNAGAWENGDLPPRRDRSSNQHQTYRDPDPADYYGDL